MNLPYTFDEFGSPGSWEPRYLEVHADKSNKLIGYLTLNRDWTDRTKEQRVVADFVPTHEGFLMTMDEVRHAAKLLCGGIPGHGRFEYVARSFA